MKPKQPMTAVTNHSFQGAPKFSLQFFGAVRLGNQEMIYSRKAQALLLFLALEPQQSSPRERIIEALWPEVDPARGRRALSDLLYRLRQAVGESLLIAERDEIGINTAVYQTDLHTFQQHIASDNPADWENAISLYHGDLAPELDELWVLPKRVALREQYLDCLWQLGLHYEQTNRPSQAISRYQALTQADPLREEAQRGLMRTLSATDRIQQALAVYDQLTADLQNALQIEPAPATQQLAATIRQQNKSQHTADLFIGRQAERKQLLFRLDQAQAGQGGAVALFGSAGIGKTRLLEELARSAEWRGWHVVWGKADEYAPFQPYGPLAQALTSALPRPRLQQMAALIRPYWLATSATILPTISQLPNLPDLSEKPPTLTQLATAVSYLLDGLQQLAPHLIILDDVQWADPALWPLLNQLVEAIRHLPILIVTSGRAELLHSPSDPADTWQAWEASGEPILELRGLSITELGQLASVHEQTAVSQQKLNELAKASGGNPLLALNLLRQNSDLSQPITLPDLVQDQLSALSDPAKLGLQAASVLGYEFDYGVWQSLLPQIPARQMPQLARELEQARLITLGEHGYRFAHDTLRLTLYESIPTARRQTLHQLAHSTLTSQEETAVLTYLYHAQQGELTEFVGDHALSAGESALAALQYETAVSHLTTALATLPNTAIEQRLAARYGRIQAYTILGQQAAHQKEINALAKLAQQIDSTLWQARAAQAQARYYWQVGLPQQSVATAETAIQLAEQTDDVTLQAHCWRLLGQSLREEGRYESAQEKLERAQSLYQQAGSEYGTAVVLDILGGVAWSLGNHAEAIEKHSTAAERFNQMGHLQNEAMALNNLGSAYWSMGNYNEAQTVLEQALAINRELGHRRSESDNLDNLGGISWVLADFPRAIELYSSALAIRRELADLRGISISLGNLGGIYQLMGEWDTAVAHLDEALSINQETGRRRGEAYNLNGRGLTYYYKGSLDKAQADLEAALAIRQDLGEKDNELITMGGLLMVHSQRGDRAEVTALCSAMAALQKPTHHASFRQWSHFALAKGYALLGNSEQAHHHLLASYLATMAVAEGFAEQYRARFLANHPLNQEILTAVSPHTHKIEVNLVRQEVPLGRKLTPADYKSIRWTIAHLADAQHADGVKKRRAIIQRLLNEAVAQGCVPTDKDLADALDVSRRTILRDMQALAEQGIVLPTRRR